MANLKHILQRVRNRTHWNLFTYQERLLDGQIRVLTVYPDEFGTPIRCELCVERLEDGPAYDALSYAWGDPSLSQTIWIREKRCAVTESVHEALQYLRPRDAELRIWIDAVCIRQDDILEKNVQVQKMGTIYERAVSCRVWLGAPLPGLESALHAIMQITMAQDVTKEQLLEHGDCIRVIMTSPWIFRLWAFQEVALSRQCTISYGHTSCDIEYLLHLPILLRRLLPTFDIESWTVIDSRYNQFGVWKAMKLLDSVEWVRRAMQTGNRQSESFISLQLNAYGRSCVDHHDHAFALRGVFERMSGGVVIPASVDYYDDVVDVFIQATTQALLRPGGMTALIVALSAIGRQVVTTKVDSWRAELPSWVPDWTSAVETREFAAWLYAAGGSLPLKLSPSAFTAGGRRLTLIGCSICLVDDCFEGVTNNVSERKWDVLEQWAMENRSLATLPAGGILHAFAKTLVADGRSTNVDYVRVKRWPSDDDCLTCKPWGEWEKVAEGLNKGLNAHSTQMSEETTREYHDTFQRSLYNVFDDTPIFSVTSSRHFALCPPGSQASDEIVVFRGVPMPFVLRKGSEETTHRMIGPAYVHGFMDGEAIEGLDKGEYELRDFIIE
ncbi:hypothetical protein LTR36_006961 [Oleoguttula mirabilis]|uniref:Heterokaryon incompatibility domain-containing protein n=1 Tax=Oleoguttula mirabilis TaxID=1507867 RepID=A0AAV9JAX5_9PEZI|nr:hypothetical protein LTR36_006961 [Oleoguttula mirabilis]